MNIETKSHNAFNEGWNAWIAGKNENENPYVSRTHLAREWDRGNFEAWETWARKGGGERSIIGEAK